MPKTKSTKKFEKKYLKPVLQRRKATAKIKQRNQLQQKKKAKKALDAEWDHGPKDCTSNKQKDAAVASMSVDEFFQGGFENFINSKPSGKPKKSSGKLGKRKRDEPDEEDGGQATSSQRDDEASGTSGLEDVVESDSEDESKGEHNAAGNGMSKKAMNDLATTDPEFYKFLEENDPEALDFDDDLAEVNALSDGEDGEPPKKKAKKQDEKAEIEDDGEHGDDNELTNDQVVRWRAQLEEGHSLRTARQVVLAFRSAVHLNEDDKTTKYTIKSPQVYHDLLILALKHIPAIMDKHIPIRESASGKVSIRSDGKKKFQTLSNLVRTFVTSIIHLLATLSDDGTLKITISALTPLVPYLLSFRKLLKNLVKSIVNFWSRNASSESTRITAFLVLRRIIVIGDKAVRESTLKALYQSLLQGCRMTNSNTIKGINLMKNSAAELWGLDQQIGYTTAFTSIRQLAIHLRNSIVNHLKESYRTVYNWQYVHALDFWSCVLAEHCSSVKEAEAGKNSLLRPLIFPLVQVTIGAMRLIPSAQYFPLRFHLYRSLLRISRATDVFIPLAPYMLEVLNSAEMKKPSKPGGASQPLDFALSYKAQKGYLKSKAYQDGVGDQVEELLSEFFYLHCTSIAFPELSLPVVIMLKRWLKQSRSRNTGNNNHKLDSNLAILVQKIEANAKFIEQKRAKVEFAPRDRSQVAAFLKDFQLGNTPLGSYVETQRALRSQKVRSDEKAKEEDKKRKALANKGEGEKEDDTDEGEY